MHDRVRQKKQLISRERLAAFTRSKKALYSK